MKYLTILLALACITLGPIPAYAEPCTGVLQVTKDINEIYGLCWEPVVAPDLKQYNIMRDGQVFDVVLPGVCAIDSCDSPNYQEQVEGTYIYSVVAVDMGDHPSAPSNTVELTIVDMPPPSSGGCSIW